MRELDTDMYLFLPADLRLIVFDIEHEMGITVGGGLMFKARNGKGRALTAEESFARIASLFIGSKHLNYSDSYLSNKFLCGRSMVHYANKTMSGYLETNPRFRKKIYTVAIKNGLMDLVGDIDLISRKREAVKKVFREDESTYIIKKQ